MSEFKGSPAPWQVSGNVVIGRIGYDICKLDGGWYTKEAQVANANLIAAAPDLLAVLIEIKNLEFGAVPLSTAKRIDLAIAKALGGSNE